MKTEERLRRTETCKAAGFPAVFDAPKFVRAYVCVKCARKEGWLA